MSNHQTTATVETVTANPVRCESCHSGIAQGEGVFIEEGREHYFRVCHRCVPGNDQDDFVFYPFLPDCPRCGGEHSPFCD